MTAQPSDRTLPIDDPDRSDLAKPAPTVPGRESAETTIPCPYCGEPVDLFLEPSGERGEEEFVEECPACSRDLEVTVRWDQAGDPHVHAERTE